MISYDGSVQCTAVTECGRVLRLEVNSLDNIYHKYTENERAIIDKPIDKPLLENASISPSGCTVAAGITMDSRNNPGNSKDRRIHRVFWATSDYREKFRFKNEMNLNSGYRGRLGMQGTLVIIGTRYAWNDGRNRDQVCVELS